MSALNTNYTSPAAPAINGRPDYQYHERLPTTETDEPVSGNEQSSPMIQPKPKPPGPSGDNDLYKPKTFTFWMTLFCNFLALFLVALDRTIIATAVPSITNEFKSLGDLGWYASAYMLTTASAQLIYGRLYKFYSMKWVFLISILIFEGGSAICGASQSSPMFIGGRAIAGIGAAGIFSGAMLIMVPMIPLHKRPLFQSIFGMVFGVASVMGPLVGGALTGALSWRWCFYINLPVGGVSLFFMIFFWTPPPQKRSPTSFMNHVKRLDPIGMFFFLPGLCCLILALQWGGSKYPWYDGRIIAFFVLFGFLSICFAFIQYFMPKTATLPARVVTQRSVYCGAFFTFFLAGSMLMMIYYVPIWFQTVKMVTPFQSGIDTLPLVMSLVASSAISGAMTTRIGYYVPSMLIAPTLMAVGEGLMSTWTQDSTLSQWVAYQFLAGFGLGFGMQAANLAVQTVLPREDIPTGVSLIFFMQQLGGAVFTSVGQAILSNLLVANLSGIPGLSVRDILRAGATQLQKQATNETLPLIVRAYNTACTRIFLCAMGVALCSALAALGMEWKSIKKNKPGPGGPGGPGAHKDSKGPMPSGAGSSDSSFMPGGPPPRIGGGGVVTIRRDSMGPPEKANGSLDGRRMSINRGSVICLDDMGPGSSSDVNEKRRVYGTRNSIARGSVINMDDPALNALISDYQSQLEAQSRVISDLSLAVNELQNRPSVLLLPPPQVHAGYPAPYMPMNMMAAPPHMGTPIPDQQFIYPAMYGTPPPPPMIDANAITYPAPTSDGQPPLQHGQQHQHHQPPPPSPPQGSEQQQKQPPYSEY